MFIKNDCSGAGVTPDTLARLVEQVTSLPLVGNYYEGLATPSVNLPENILLFSREGQFAESHAASHHRFVLIVCLKTEGSILLDDLVIRMQPGMALLMHPHQCHHYANFGSEALLWLFITFEGVAIAPLLPLRDSPQPLSTVAHQQLLVAVDAFSRAFPQHVGTSTLALSLRLLLDELVATQKRAGGIKPLAEEGHLPASQRFMQAVATYVHGHRTEPVSVADVAEAVGLSPSRLRARFQEMSGIGVGRFIRRTRLHHACVLIRSSEMSVTEIADHCGFDSVYSFSRTFKQELGVTPTAYRRGEVGQVGQKLSLVLQ